MNKSELLVPAGSFDALIAAVNNGADAVYMGGSRFNARQFADNFSDEMLYKAVKYAHTYGVKIYITLNTLVKEKELSELRDYIKVLDSCRVDGIIVQDLGVSRILAKEFPQLILHASTQMTIHQSDGARLLEKAGFKRVVLSRELTLDEIKYISDNTILEIEAFIHGALCICYSGQCLMSSMFGGRSGNRGMCAQPCRLPYSIANVNQGMENTMHYLSPKDLSTISFLDKILEAGVKSLKIEGRMKRPEYVAVVTKVYRMVLDKLDKGIDISDYTEYERELMQIFNRGGFTKGYLMDFDDDDLMSMERPNHWGVHMGTVVSCKDGFAYIKLDKGLDIGDSVEFRPDSGKCINQSVDNIRLDGRPVERARPGQIISIKAKGYVAAGARVYKTASQKQLDEARATYKTMYARKIPLKAEAVLKLGELAKLTLTDENGIKASAYSEVIVQQARSKPLTYESVESQLNRLGDTPYIYSEINIAIDDNSFIPVSELNKLRRDAVELITMNRIDFYTSNSVNILSENRSDSITGESIDSLLKNQSEGLRSESMDSLSKNQNESSISNSNGSLGSIKSDEPISVEDDNPNETYTEPDSGNKVKLCGYVDTLDYPVDTYEGLDTLYYDPLIWPTEIDSLIEQVDKLKSSGFAVNLVLPRIAREEDMEALKGMPQQFWKSLDGYQAGNLGVVNFLLERGINPINGGYSLNVFNSEAVKFLDDFGIASVCLSPELTIGEIHDIIDRSKLPCEILVFGYIPLMIMENELNAQSLADRKKYHFKVRKRKIARVYTEIINSMPIFPIDNMYKVQRASRLSWGLNLHGYSAGRIKSIVSIYRHIADNPGDDLPESLKTLSEDIKSTGYTKGHLFRGVD